MAVGGTGVAVFVGSGADVAVGGTGVAVLVGVGGTGVRVAALTCGSRRDRRYFRRRYRSWSPRLERFRRRLLIRRTRTETNRRDHHQSGKHCNSDE